MMKVGLRFLPGLALIACIDVQAYVEVSNFSVGEGDGTVDAAVTLRSHIPDAAPVKLTGYTVAYTTVDGTAQDEFGSGDYTKKAGNLNFAAFNTPQNVTIAITQDILVEGTEQFYLDATVLANPAVRGTGTLNDDDSKLTVTTSSNRASVAGGSAPSDLSPTRAPSDFKAAAALDMNVTLTCDSGNIDPPPPGKLTATKMTTGGVVNFDLVDHTPATNCSTSLPDGTPQGYEKIVSCTPLSPSVTTCDYRFVPIVAPIPTLGLYGLILLSLLILATRAVLPRRFI
ncbi:MAG: hypothetical protein HOC23_23975 [Halieaceae bacterium]|jgi:hypothetical protein|nr:hypothetical protein [Halieaceae bacterium]